jgi:hypothetical protein
MDYELSFLKALFLTIFIETSVLFLLFKIVYRTSKINNWILLLTGILASMATLPYLWFIIPLFVKTRLYYIVIGEVSVTAIESIIIWGILRTNYTKALIASVLCNTTSFLIGLFIHL